MPNSKLLPKSASECCVLNQVHGSAEYVELSINSWVAQLARPAQTFAHAHTKQQVVLHSLHYSYFGEFSLVLLLWKDALHLTCTKRLYLSLVNTRCDYILVDVITDYIIFVILRVEGMAGIKLILVAFRHRSKCCLSTAASFCTSLYQRSRDVVVYWQPRLCSESNSRSISRKPILRLSSMNFLFSKLNASAYKIDEFFSKTEHQHSLSCCNTWNGPWWINCRMMSRSTKQPSQDVLSDSSQNATNTSRNSHRFLNHSLKLSVLRTISVYMYEGTHFCSSYHVKTLISHCHTVVIVSLPKEKLWLEFRYRKVPGSY